MALMTITLVKDRFAKWATDWVVQHNLALAHANGDIETISSAAASMSPIEQKALLGHLFPDMSSQSSDVIFVPATQSTKYSAMRSAKTNLERRMPNFTITTLDVSGHGVIRFYAHASYLINGVEIELTADCHATSSDMVANTIELSCDGEIKTIEPMHRIAYPEDIAKMLNQIAINCVP